MSAAAPVYVSPPFPVDRAVVGPNSGYSWFLWTGTPRLFVWPIVCLPSPLVVSRSEAAVTLSEYIAVARDAGRRDRLVCDWFPAPAPYRDLFARVYRSSPGLWFERRVAPGLTVFEADRLPLSAVFTVSPDRTVVSRAST